MKYYLLLLLLAGCKTYDPSDCGPVYEHGKRDESFLYLAKVQCSFGRMCLTEVNYTERKIRCE